MDTATILLIDDNPANLKVLFDLLDEAGFEVLVSQRGEGALKRAKDTQPDLILLDVMMPGINGFETCERLKNTEQTRDIPVIFMTVLSDSESKVKGFEIGAVDYITKPIQAKEVLARVKTHLTIQHLQRELLHKNRKLTVSLEKEHEFSQLKSRFISLVSHEFKTPLTTIMLSSNLLKRYSTRMSPEKQNEEIGVIEKAVRHMNTLLEDVLTISRGEAKKVAFEPEPTKIVELFQQQINRFEALSEGKHQFELSPQLPYAKFSIDPKLLDHVLSNLLSNALKYSPQGGKISCELAEDNGELIFRISDEGIGISEADLPHLFEHFHRGENISNIQGTGLGLSIVKQLVETHGGSIVVESQLTKGSCFTVRIPAPASK